MTPAEQNRAIAEWDGWKPEVRRTEIPEAQFVHEETFWTKGSETRRRPWLPSYTSDLNEINQATLDMRNVEEYGAQLKWLLGRYWTAQGRNPEQFCDESWIFAAAHATAAQRAEALLRTIGKWKE